MKSFAIASLLIGAASAVTFEEERYRIDTRSDLSTNVPHGHNSPIHQREFNILNGLDQNTVTRRGGLPDAPAGYAKETLKLDVLKGHGARTCNTVQCRHEIHECNGRSSPNQGNGECGVDPKTGIKQRFSSVRVTHKCVTGDKTDAEKKTRHCTEDVCTTGHYCAMNRESECECVEREPFAAIPGCTDQWGDKCHKCDMPNSDGLIWELSDAHGPNSRCKLHGGWTNFSPWSTCSKSCGGGTQVNYRTCTNPSPQYGGDDCVGPEETSRPCNTQPCPIDGNWGTWSSLQPCSVTACGLTGTRTKTRTCTNPPPQFGGKSCVGPASDSSTTCATDPCPINGGWSNWSSLQPCSVTACGLTGTRTKTRTCTNPSPEHGGAYCVGPASDSSTTCATDPCPINGGWSDWGAWGACSTTCGPGMQTKTRTCTNPSPNHGGAYCDGDATMSQSCNMASCKTYSWSKDEVSCPTTCDTEESTIDDSYTCTDNSDGSEVADNLCDGSKPSTTTSCDATISCDMKWFDYIEMETVYVSGDDWTTAECPTGKYIMGGGCKTADDSPHTFERNAPISNTQWQCGGHSMKKEVWAVCSNIETTVTTTESGEDWANYGCDDGKQMLGGGCRSHGGAYIFQTSRPRGDADEWQCGGHGSAKDVTLICADKSKIKMDVSTDSDDKDWDSASCAHNHKVMGGGCYSDDPYKIQGMWPNKDDNSYECGGHGGTKTVYAMCAHRPDGWKL